MEQTVTIVERKPFHEAVISMIQQASRDELETIGTLLIKTRIPKGHDEIVEAWRARCLEMGWADVSIRYVEEDVLLHKRQLETAKEEKESNPLDRFRFEDEKNA
ncbi:MAG: hypothetical protein A2431_00470 [Candidatus Zambryskibacteria bacterium RIFOXYC1_FULL_39_10]|uniref:Uncharacterized protein n=1 Tax=Candidatus Zambryskibacteria bacterium RIFOXYC1_FULL_39_10 TaxID=1802779 RepID=A0A1G2UZ72_9BACT|nr:MAG: hypothetical protein A2431_00470 [Candidatus Zambryskibacteria bacterium RIFOXYC1_FULL_39_10]OHB15619.1 MAG: hypothetical protein A2605_02330 [Candidatus Zambryskibacteria bacterium RIFOXYD1_FULL_39_35]